MSLCPTCSLDLSPKLQACSPAHSASPLGCQTGISCLTRPKPNAWLSSFPRPGSPPCHPLVPISVHGLSFLMAQAKLELSLAQPTSSLLGGPVGSGFGSILSLDFLAPSLHLAARPLLQPPLGLPASALVLHGLFSTQQLSPSQFMSLPHSRLSSGSLSLRLKSRFPIIVTCKVLHSEVMFYFLPSPASSPMPLAFFQLHLSPCHSLNTTNMSLCRAFALAPSSGTSLR